MPVLRTVRVRGAGARAVREQGALLVFSKWIVKGWEPEPYELVIVEDEGGEVLGCGVVDPVGPARLRLLHVGDYCPWSSVSEAIRDLLARALRVREKLGYTGEGRAYRLINADGDFMPGLIVDVYSDLVVFQSSSAVWDHYRDELVEALVELLGDVSIYEKSTQRTRRDIGLEPREGLVRGTKTRTIIVEGAARFIVDARLGQKTGFFLDQAPNRVDAERLAGEGRVVDLFAYTGGFGVHALIGGAREAVFVDSDADALRLLRENLKLNAVEDKARVVEDDVWRFLRRERRRYDAVFVDPPAFIPDARVKERGVEGYRNLFRRSQGLAGRGATLFLSSCSAHLTWQEFLSIVADALRGRVYRIVTRRGVPPDHPVRPGAPYLDYLKSAYLIME